MNVYVRIEFGQEEIEAVFPLYTTYLFNEPLPSSPKLLVDQAAIHIVEMLMKEVHLL
jgi:hypothetical protein